MRWWHASSVLNGRKAEGDKPVVVVSGLPRSGTSMMMQALVAGGVPAITDGARVADQDNPRGYFELEAVKSKADPREWLEGGAGRVVKVISALLARLPCDREYEVVFMRRALEEVLESQRRMIARRGERLVADDAVLRPKMEKHLRDVEGWLAAQPCFRVLYVDYADVLADPKRELARIGDFLGRSLDLDAMVAAVDPSLRRVRGDTDHPRQ